MSNGTTPRIRLRVVICATVASYVCTLAGLQVLGAEGRRRGVPTTAHREGARRTTRSSVATFLCIETGADDHLRIEHPQRSTVSLRGNLLAAEDTDTRIADHSGHGPGQ